MTLILTLGNREQVIQISDRRLSWNGKPFDDESNKAGILLCKDSRQIFGFTGLAKWGEFDTWFWILNTLFECCSPDFQINNIMARFKEKASNDFQNLPILKNIPSKHKRLSIMFSGYNYYINPPVSVCGILTNYQDFTTGIDEAKAWDHFEMNCWTEHRPLDYPFTHIQRIGSWLAMNKEDELSLRNLLKESKPFEAIANKGVSIVRKMADRRKANNNIGKQLSVTILFRNITSHTLAYYYSNVVQHTMYLPDQVIAINDQNYVVMADINIHAKNSDGSLAVLAVPKVHDNAPCPCKGGLKYKDCHKL